MVGSEKHFAVEVEEVHSGDDLILMVDLGVDGLHKRVRARLKGVDTPSAFRAKGGTEAGAVRSTLKGMLATGTCAIALHSAGKGGWMVTLFVSDASGATTNINDYLIQQGYVYQTKKQESL